MNADVRHGELTAATFNGFEHFRHDMRAQQIHVGLSYTGDVACCATCDEPWPCPTAQGAATWPR